MLNTKVLHYIFWASLTVFLLVLPVAHTIALRYIALFTLLGITGLAAYRFRIIPALPLWGPWVAYLIVAAVATALAINPSDSLSEFKVEVIYYVIIFTIGAFWGGLQKKFVPFVALLAVINTAMTLSAFYFSGINMPFGEVKEIPPFAYAGLDGNWLLIAMMLYVWLAVYFWETNKRLLAILVVALIALDCWAMLVTHNRQNFIALGAGAIGFSTLYLWKYFTVRRALVCGLALCFIVALAGFQMVRRSGETATVPQAQAAAVLKATNTDVRWDLWKFSLEKIAQNPLVGGGLGRSVFDKLYPDYRPEIGELWHAHNMIINKGIQMGVPGMIAFLVLWLSLGRELLSHFNRGGVGNLLALAGLSGIIAVFAKNQTDDFFVRNVALFFWLVMGLLIGHLRSLQSQHKSV